jgi:hypothetical protein
LGTKTGSKGLVLTLRSSTGTGAVRVAPRANKSQVALEVLDAAGGITQIRLSLPEAEVLSEHLAKLAAPTRSRRPTDAVTQVGGRLEVDGEAQRCFG